MSLLLRLRNATLDDNSIIYVLEDILKIIQKIKQTTSQVQTLKRAIVSGPMKSVYIFL